MSCVRLSGFVIFSFGSIYIIIIVLIFTSPVSRTQWAAFLTPSSAHCGGAAMPLSSIAVSGSDFSFHGGSIWCGNVWSYQ